MDPTVTVVAADQESRSCAGACRETFARELPPLCGGSRNCGENPPGRSTGKSASTSRLSRPLGCLAPARGTARGTNTVSPPSARPGTSNLGHTPAKSGRVAVRSSRLGNTRIGASHVPPPDRRSQHPLLSTCAATQVLSGSIKSRFPAGASGGPNASPLPLQSTAVGAALGRSPSESGWRDSLLRVPA